ncbi:hypothetical protein OHA21_43835 [Actinoplanes sp. NBC_00393]|uniref:hypothetical protein n=1 Tax=Actinoplanes sp. NBC_00393 TaxID=2975953 RepID=UPI002E1E08A6
MEPSVVKKALAAAVRAKSIPQLECYSYSPHAPTVPAFTIGEVSINPHETFRGMETYDVTCSVLTSTADDEAGQELLDKLLAKSGTYSVREALLDARGAPGELALDGAADDLSIERIDGYRMLAYAGQDSTYYGADITVRVIGD